MTKKNKHKKRSTQRHTTIPPTLHATKIATFAVLLPDQAQDGLLTPHGTAFLVSPDGYLVTARHVVADDSGNIRSDISQMHLMKEMEPGKAVPPLQGVSLIHEDASVDLALLKLDSKGLPFLTISTRVLDDGEPVYAFGYPLSSGEMVYQDKNVSVGQTTLVPRTTSAVVAAHRESHGMIVTGGDPQVYGLDKALNYGNSGGPIVATRDGRVHAVCSRFQPVPIGQPPGVGVPVVLIPSLYCVVSRVSDPRFLAVLESEGIDFDHND